MKIKRYNNYNKLFLTLIFLFIFILNTVFTKDSRSNYVPNAQTAIKVAEAIWLPMYGDIILEHKPYKAILLEDRTWHVWGTCHTLLGGCSTY